MFQCLITGQKYKFPTSHLVDWTSNDLHNHGMGLNISTTFIYAGIEHQARNCQSYTLLVHWNTSAYSNKLDGTHERSMESKEPIRPAIDYNSKQSRRNGKFISMADVIDHRLQSVLLVRTMSRPEPSTVDGRWVSPYLILHKDCKLALIFFLRV